MTTLDIYWSYRSPYSHLAIDRLADIAMRYKVETRFRPVRPLALREEGFFKRARPQFLPYLLKDVMREGQRLGIPIAPPQPDPIVMDLATGEVDAEQPYITLLMDLGLAACENGRGLEFALSASRRVWGGVQNWHEDDHLRDAASEAGLDYDELRAWAEANPSLISAAIADNESAQMKHHWGVPLMVINDEEAFFGQDRLDALEWRLEQMDLRK